MKNKKVLEEMVRRRESIDRVVRQRNVDEKYERVKRSLTRSNHQQPNIRSSGYSIESSKKERLATNKENIQ